MFWYVTCALPSTMLKYNVCPLGATAEKSNADALLAITNSAIKQDSILFMVLFI